MKISNKELTDFLNAANKATYANKDATKSASLRPSSEDYHFEQEDLTYHDTYFGAKDFIGGEIIYKKEIPIWGANYYGYIVSEKTEKSEVYDFLRQALMQEYSGIIPVRGPKEFKNGELKYTNKAEGTLDRFIGVEEIWKGSELLYRCDYRGGFIE